VVDWLDYDTHYTERYLGLPEQNPKGYRDSSLLTHASKLERPLLLVHGTGDDNVFFLHTLKLADGLFRAGKDHELLPLSGFTHMVNEPEARRRLEERTVRFFQRHL
jgi:dipeptidyl-peptidase-4